MGKPVPLQKCNTCLRLLPVALFHRDVKSKSGRKGKCRNCCAEDRRHAQPRPREGIQLENVMHAWVRLAAAAT